MLEPTPVVRNPAFPLVDTGPIALAIARRGQAGALAQRFRRHFDAPLPEANRCTRLADVTAVWAGPEQWLLLGSLGGFTAEPQASLSDQSDGRAVFALPVEHARDILAKGTAVDLHESAFARGGAALTRLNHFAVSLWRPDTGPDRICVAIARSYAESLNDWLRTASGVKPWGVRTV
ncbi:MAG: hypothetical protein MI723_01540 [Caulobacterales bacterium]|nr:hypothetical protein [Caulobacterales bacterium]